MLIVVSSVVRAEEEGSAPPPTNLQLIQKLSEEISDSLGSLIPVGDSVRVIVEPRESSWYIQGVVMRAISKHGCVPCQSVTAPYEMTLGALTSEVRYSNVRRSGFLASKVVDRVVDVLFASSVVNKNSGVILFNQNLSRSVHDTVAVSDIPRLENPGIPATHGGPLSEGFFSTILEPVVTIGAIAVGVYLLFHVRSQ